MSNNTVNKFIMPNGDEIKIDSGSGLELCDIGISLYVDETKGLRRYLNGQIVDINTNTQAFLNRLLEIHTTNPDIFTTEDNWQAEALLNIDGCVYKFVLNYADDGETVVSVRLPKYPDYVEINAGGTLPVVGNGMTLGLTDGTNYSSLQTDSSSGNLTTGQQYYGTNVGTTSNSGTRLTINRTYGITTDPTKSGIQTTLKQTKLKLRYFIQIATGSETEANIVNTLENVNGFTLLESKYSDKPLYNESWLLSNGQWNAKAVYPTAYEGLQVEYNTEIEVGTTVTLPSGVSYTKRGLSVKLSTETYTDYDFVLNTAEETFRLKLSNNQRFVIETYTDGANGYRIWSDGYCEQWGGYGTAYTSYTTITITFLKKFKDTNYYLIHSNAGNGAVYEGVTYTKSTNNFSVVNSANYNSLASWKAGGYLAEGEHTPLTNILLYFYVGDIDQNHGIVNMGRIGEQLATKTDILQASGAGMPSDKYIDLTLGADGSTYTAPANGWFSVKVTMNISGGFFVIVLKNGLSYGSGVLASDSNNDYTVPVKRGDVIVVYYTSIKNGSIRFIYAEGSK